MSDMVRELMPFLAILNPFALCLYLEEAMHKLRMRAFAGVLARASVISLLAFWFFALAGRPFLNSTLQVRPEALRIFGGIIFLVIAYHYTMRGHQGTEVVRGDITQLPAAIALPFMIGAGTITQSMLMRQHLPPVSCMFTLFLGVAISFGIVLAFKALSDHLKRRSEATFYRYADIVARLNGLLIGAISVEMIVEGVHQLWAAG